MRILSGQYKGRPLLSFSKTLPIRPMTQRVKKSVFDTLRPIFQQNHHVRVLDLFSGCGNLSFEALSQGASECYAVESHPLCCQLIQKNSDQLGTQTKLTVCRQDVFLFLRKYQEKPFDLIFIDPPFKKMYGQKVIKALNSSLVCDNNTWVVLETSVKETLSKELSIIIHNQKNFGDKKVYFLFIKKKRMIS